MFTGFLTRFISVVICISLFAQSLAFAEATEPLPEPEISLTESSQQVGSNTQEDIKTIEKLGQTRLPFQYPGILTKERSVKFVGGFLKSMLVLWIVATIDLLRETIHRRHLEIKDRKQVQDLARQASDEIAKDQSILHKTAEKVFGEPFNLVFGALVGALFNFITAHIPVKEAIAGAATGIVLTLGYDWLADTMAVGTVAVRDRAPLYCQNGRKDYCLNDRQRKLVTELADPNNYSTYNFYSGLHSKDPDERTVHRLIKENAYALMISDPEFVFAVFSFWKRSHLTGDSLTKMGVLILSAWIDLHTAAFVASLVGTSVEPGGGTIGGYVIGLLAGVPITIAIGLMSARIFSPELKDDITYISRVLATESYNIGSYAGTELEKFKNDLSPSSAVWASIANTELEKERRQAARQRSTLTSLDLIQLSVDRIEDFENSRLDAITKKQALLNQGKLKFYLEEYETRAEDAALFFLPPEPTLNKIITQDTMNIRIYRQNLELLSSSILQNIDSDLHFLDQVRTLFGRSDIISDCEKEMIKLSRIKTFYTTLFAILKRGSHRQILSKEYLRARQTLERLTFWHTGEEKLYNAITYIDSSPQSNPSELGARLSPYGTDMPEVMAQDKVNWTSNFH